MFRSHSSLRNIKILTIVVFCSVLLAFFLVNTQSHFFDNLGGWQFSLREPSVEQMANSGVRPVFSVHESFLYFNGLDGKTYSINPKIGRLNWINEELNLIFSSQNNLVFSTNNDTNIYALNTRTGEEIWRYTTPDRVKIDTIPVLTGRDILFGGRDGVLYAISKEDGKFRWSFKTKSIDKSYHKGGETILHFGKFTTDKTTLYLNSATENKLFAINLESGKKLWQRDLENYYFTEPTLFDSSVSFWDSPNSYKIVNKTSGELLIDIKTEKKSLYEGKSCIYIIAIDNSIECTDPNLGKPLWKLSEPYDRATNIQETSEHRTHITYPNVSSTIVETVDNRNGKVAWSYSFSNFETFKFRSTNSNVILIGQKIQCAFSMLGELQWCTNKTLDLIDSLISTDGVYILSKKEDNIVIDYIDINSGKTKWVFRSKDINPDTFYLFRNDLYFLGKNGFSVAKLNSDFRNIALSGSNLKKIGGIDIPLSNWVKFLKRLGKFEKEVITIDDPQKFVQKFETFELTIHSNIPTLEKLQSNRIHVIKMTSPSGAEYTLKGFYYDLKTWKFRFTPGTIGLWKWSLETKAKIKDGNKEGAFIVGESDSKGFISLSKINPKYLAQSNGNIFLPIGIQNCVNDLHQDGNPLNSWPLDDEAIGSKVATGYKTTTMEDYVTTYAESGFNTYRWGAGNCSFMLWNFDRTRLGPLVNEGILLDTIFATLKKNRFHVWMSLLSFELPYEATLPFADQKAILEKYLDYIVSRYASYVDVWELANEIKLSDPIIQFMASHIRSIDPYKHPITTSWERTDLQDIEIISYHWYSGECNKYCDQDLIREVNKFEKFNKPTVFTEQGNNYANWDDASPDRFRIRLWLSFFKQISFISWNMPNVYFENDTGPSNLYIGPVERSYALIFSKFVKDVSDNNDIQKIPITSTEKQQRTFAVSSGNNIYGYVYSTIFNVEKSLAKISLVMDNDGTIQWVNPSSGEVLKQQYVSKGQTDIIGPMFTTDIAFKFSKQSGI